MQVKTLAFSPLASLQIPKLNRHSGLSLLSLPTRCVPTPHFPSKLRFLAPKNSRNCLRSKCLSSSEKLIDSEPENDSDVGSASSFTEQAEEEAIETEVEREGLENLSIWKQLKEIVMFTGPATGLWLCGPLMSLIDTAVIGQSSSLELAALGPGTVICDYTGYAFMFLSIATSNLVATSLARKDRDAVQHQISILLFVGLTCGVLMLLLARFFGLSAITAFTGPKNAHLVPAANTYVQIRALASPAVLVGWVAQSASLGMKESWGPLKALAVASIVNGVGDVVLCIFLGYGIAGAAWATMVSQVIAAFMMIDALNKKGYNALAISVPTLDELLTILGLAAPVFVTLTSKVAFYALIIYFATSMGTHPVAAHQVMVQTYGMCTVWGEPLSQTAQSFMPELIYGVNRSLEKARMLLKSLVIIGVTLGSVLGIIGTFVPWLFPNIFTPDQNARMLLKSLVIIGVTLGSVLGIIGTFVPWLFPNIFTPDQKVIQEMHKVLIPYFIALVVTPSTHSLEGTLLAGRDLKFLSISMTGCFLFGALVLMFVSTRGYGLAGCWFALAGFQWARFFLSLQRLLSPNGILYSEDLSRYKVEELKET